MTSLPLALLALCDARGVTATAHTARALAPPVLAPPLLTPLVLSLAVQPDYAILDECTSAVSTKMEERLYWMLARKVGSDGPCRAVCFSLQMSFRSLCGGCSIARLTQLCLADC